MKDSTFGGLIVVGIIGLLLVLMFGIGGWTTIPAGSRGVLLHFGAAKEVLNEGASFKWPFVESVQVMSVQTSSLEVKEGAASKDLQTVSIALVVNYNVDPNHVLDLYKDVGVSYATSVMTPALLECAKAVTAQYTAEELITKR